MNVISTKSVATFALGAVFGMGVMYYQDTLAPDSPLANSPIVSSVIANGESEHGRETSPNVVDAVVVNETPAPRKVRTSWTPGRTPTIPLPERALIEKRLDQLIDSVDEPELLQWIAALTGSTPIDLDEVADVYTFASRLAQAAMVGLDSDEDVVHPDAPSVRFTTDIEAYIQGRNDGRERFRPNESRIYAVFDTEDYAGSSVYAKWYLRDFPSNLVFEHQQILEDAPLNFVYADVNGWPPGAYQVEIYSADDDVQLLAASSYIIAENIAD